MTASRPAPEPRQPLSRERVIDAAMRLADSGGIGALTMRRLAQQLGVEAMTLYYYVRNKEEILGALVDAAMADWELPSPGADWKDAIRTTALSAYASLGRHPWAAGLMLSLRQPSPERLRYMDSILGALQRAGFSEDDTDHAYHVIEGHIMGFSLWEVGMDLPDPADLRALADAFLSRVPASDYPHVVEHVEHHLTQRPAADRGAFEFGLDLILDGLERLPRS